MPPYTSAEVAAALVTAAADRGWTLQRLQVRADDGSRLWTISAVVQGVRRHALFPFASRHGIYTPTELADHFLSGDWQFGHP